MFSSRATDESTPAWGQRAPTFARRGPAGLDFDDVPDQLTLSCTNWRQGSAPSSSLHHWQDISQVASSDLNIRFEHAIAIALHTCGSGQ